MYTIVMVSPSLFDVSQASGAAAAHPISRIPSLEKQPGDVTLHARTHAFTERECEREFQNVLDGGIIHLKLYREKKRQKRQNNNQGLANTSFFVTKNTRWKIQLAITLRTIIAV